MARRFLTRSNRSFHPHPIKQAGARMNNLSSSAKCDFAKAISYKL
jgi:hypothetical protein